MAAHKIAIHFTLAEQGIKMGATMHRGHQTQTHWVLTKSFH